MRTMANIRGPGPFKRRIISVVVIAIILYACHILSESLSMGTTRSILFSVYRLSANRRISGFSTVFDGAVLVLINLDKCSRRGLLSSVSAY